MRFYFVMALVVFAAATVPAAGDSRPDIEIHAVADCADSIAPSQIDPNTHQKICVAPTMIVGGSDVIGVRATVSRVGVDVLEVDLNEKASSSLFRYTLSRVHRQIAILIDGKLVNVPIVLEPLIDRRFQIAGLSKEEITAIAERFQMGPPI